jgi:hypothetical protein
VGAGACQPAEPDTLFTSGSFVRRTSGQATPGTVTIPEPAGLALVGLGALALAGRRRKA